MNTQGIQAKIIACVGSVGAGFSFCWSHMEIPKIKGKMPRKIKAMIEPGSGVPKGNSPKRFRIEEGSGALRSLIQPIQGAWRNSSVTKITLYSEKKIGICNRIGKQPEACFCV